jgi:RNA polymerase sigma-70 factor (ECF subfamily)
LHENSSDLHLIRAVAQKDTEAFKTLMQKYQERIYRTVFRFTGDVEVSKDLTQDIFLKVFRSADTYSPNAQFFTWLYRITVNHCLNFVRKRRVDPLSHTKDNPEGDFYTTANHMENTGAQVLLERQEKGQIVRQALDSLPGRQKIAIVLHRFEGLHYRDIAIILGCSVSAVESLIFRGMQTLKRRLSHECKEYFSQEKADEMPKGPNKSYSFP